MRSAVVRARRWTLISVVVTVAALGWAPGQALAASSPDDPLLGSVAQTTSGTADLVDPVQGIPFPGLPKRSPILCPTPWTRSWTRRPTRSKASPEPPPGSWTPSPMPHPGRWMPSPARQQTSWAESRTPSGRLPQARAVLRPCRLERPWAGSRVSPQQDLPAGMGPALCPRPGRWSSAPLVERPSSRHEKGPFRRPTSARHPASRSHRRRARRARPPRIPWQEGSPRSSGSCWPSAVGRRSHGSPRHSCFRSSGWPSSVGPVGDPDTAARPQAPDTAAANASKLFT